jgi:hypothetical protein
MESVCGVIYSNTVFVTAREMRTDRINPVLLISTAAPGRPPHEAAVLGGAADQFSADIIPFHMRK